MKYWIKSAKLGLVNLENVTRIYINNKYIMVEFVGMDKPRVLIECVSVEQAEEKYNQIHNWLNKGKEINV